MRVVESDLVDDERPIPLGRAAVEPAISEPVAAEPAAVHEDAAPIHADTCDQPAADDHPLAALRGFRFEMESGAAALAGRRLAVGRFIAAYLLVAAVVVALVAGFLLLAGGWRTTT